MNDKIEILGIAQAQFSKDYNCTIEDFKRNTSIITRNEKVEGRRVYDSDGCFIKIMCFEGKVIISTAPQIQNWCKEQFLNANAPWFFEYPNLKFIDKKIQEFGHEIADVHHYYLPQSKQALGVEPIMPIKWYGYEEIFSFKGDNRFQEALAFDENHPDVLAVAAFDKGKIVGMAGASRDSETMWQIGIDVIPEYRGKRLGSNLVKLLKNEVLRRGKVPFYGTAESHIGSQNIAINAGFFPAWAELYSKEKNNG